MFMFGERPFGEVLSTVEGKKIYIGLLCFREVKGVVYLISINTLEDAFINLVELRTPNIFHHQIREMWRNDCTPEVAQG